MREHLAQGVVRDLADEGAPRAERGHAGQRVGRRAAGDLRGLAHMGVQLFGTRGVDQGHAATGQAQVVDHVVTAVRQYVDDGIADRDHVVSRLGLGFGHADRFPRA